MDALNHFSSPIFLLDLLVDKTVHQHLRGIILGLHRRLINRVHAERVVALHRLRLLRDFEQGFEILFGHWHPGR